jgi:hypothetical protein
MKILRELAWRLFGGFPRHRHRADEFSDMYAEDYYGKEKK